MCVCVCKTLVLYNMNVPFCNIHSPKILKRATLFRSAVDFLRTAIYSAKYLESFEMCCWRRMEKISWTDRVSNEAVLHIGKEERNILHTIRWRKANLIGHILRRNCLLRHVIEGKIRGTRRRGRRRKQLLSDLKEAKRYWKLEEAQDRTLWRTQFGRGYWPVARQTTTWSWDFA
jgi:hypothetical protein